MTINGLNPQEVYKSQMSGAAYGANSAGSKSSQAGESDAESRVGNSAGNTADRVEISQHGADITQARALARKADLSGDEAARSSRVEELRQQVQSGTYSVSSKEIARSILGGNLDRKA